jgi:P pilus assembly chaperone PapD
MNPRVLQWLATAALLLPFAASAAGSVPLGVAPVSVKMDTSADYAAVEVSNRGETATGIEVEILRVRWVNGQEQYEATEDFVVSPAAFRLAADKNRMVRFQYTGRRQSSEGFYRLFIRQLPESRPDSQINMVFNVGVPVFVAPVESRPGLRVSNGTVTSDRAELRNTGNVTLKISQLEGKNCPPAALKLVARLAPDQKLPLEAGLSQCATGAQTDRGLMMLHPVAPASTP